MQRIEVIDPRRRRWLVEVPVTHRERTHGLRGRRWLPPDHAMLFQRCRSVHTVGMEFPIALALLDARFRVVAVRRLPPGRVLFPRPGVRHILECPYETDLRPGDRLIALAPFTLPGDLVAPATHGGPGNARRARR
jgi:uncharacterized membrane protein (UPF0127 family)